MHLTNKTVNVLFLSVGRRVELLSCFRRAYRALGLAGKIVATDVDSLAPALHFADRAYIVPPIAAPDYSRTLVKICRREQINIVFPLVDPDVAMLVKRGEDLEATGARLSVVSPSAFEVLHDKRRSSQFFRSLGLATPRSWDPGVLDAATAPYPLFIKPRSGSASQNAFAVTDARALEFFREYVPDPLIEEYLPGPEITTDVVCDLNGDLLGLVSRRRIEVRNGEVSKGVTVFEPEIAEACQKIAAALPAVGPITVQCIMKDSRPYFTEINARFGGGAPLGIAAGVDSPLWLLASAAGADVDIPIIGSYTTGLMLTRYDESLIISEATLEQMASRHI